MTNGQELKITATGIGNSTVSETTTGMKGDTKTLNEGLNYIQLNVWADGGGYLTVDYSPGLIDKNSTALINAIQLSSTAHAPEPASMVLLGVGGLLAALRLRKKSSQNEISL